MKINIQLFNAQPSLLSRSNCISVCCNNAEPNPHPLPRFAFIIRTIEGSRFCSQINCLESIFSTEGLLKLIFTFIVPDISLLLSFSFSIPMLSQVCPLSSILYRPLSKVPMRDLDCQSHMIQCGEICLSKIQVFFLFFEDPSCY